MNYYDILGVNIHSDKDEIKKAYRKAVKLHHPDVGGDTVFFKQIQKAYDVLMDDDTRRQYDTYFRSSSNQSKSGSNNYQQATNVSNTKSDNMKKQKEPSQEQKNVSTFGGLFIIFCIIVILIVTSNANKEQVSNNTVNNGTTQNHSSDVVNMGDDNQEFSNEAEAEKEVNLEDLRVELIDLVHGGGDYSNVILGKVFNYSDYSVTHARVNLTFYDKEGNIVGNENSSLFHHGLKKGEYALFKQMIFLDYDEYETIETNVVVSDIDRQNEDNTLENIRIEVTDINYYDYTVFAKVYNKSNKVAENVEIEYSFYDSTGLLVDFDSTIVRDIPPGEYKLMKSYYYTDERYVNEIKVTTRVY